VDFEKEHPFHGKNFIFPPFLGSSSVLKYNLLFQVGRPKLAIDFIFDILVTI